MSTRQWLRLARVYLERLKQPVLLILGSLVPLSLLFARKQGYEPQEVVTNLLLVAALLPFGAGGIVTRSKADGTLAFIAALPVSRDDHARSWLAVVLLLSLPLAVTVMLLMYMEPLQLRGVPLVMAGLSATVLTASAVMTMNAFQLSVRPAMAGAYFVVGMAAVVGVIATVGAVFDIGAASVIRMMRAEWFLVGVCTAVWVVAGLAFWWSWQRIGHFMTSYVGDPPKA